MANYVNQSGRRKGSTAMYLEVWHADIETFLDLKKPIGDEALRCCDLFLALWMCDLFMKRLIMAVENKSKNSNDIIYWSLMCPHKCQNLVDSYGEDFERLYLSYEEEKCIINKLIYWIYGHI